jgi:LysM repeat protein
MFGGSEMSTVENNPVYYIEEDNKKPSQVYYKSNNDALLRKVSQPSGRHNKIIRTIVVLVLLVIAVSCIALIHAFASTTHEQPVQSVAATHTESIAIEAVSVKVNTVIVDKGDTLWAIANKNAPNNMSIHSYINKLMKINGLSKPILQVGQALVLPSI